ncbi:MAG: NrfD/PsrC family molybdoenzyme membrane anchor subunit [bacterium]
MENHVIEWGQLVVFYLFLAGMSAGTFVTSVFAAYADPERYKNIVRMGSFISPIPVSVGCAILLLDLGRPFHFYNLYRTVQWTSPMSIGSWLLAIFIVISSIRAYTFFPEQWKIVKLPFEARIRGATGLVGLPIALGVGIYTGILLGAIPARPFWNTPLLAELFLFSALSTGVATLLLICSLNPMRSPESTKSHEHKFLLSFDIVLITIEIFIIIPIILHSQLSALSIRESIFVILGGPYTVVFWVGTVLCGLLVPLAIELFEMSPNFMKKAQTHWNPVLGVTSSVLIIIGGFLLRYVVTYGGQLSGMIE